MHCTLQTSLPLAGNRHGYLSTLRLEGPVREGWMGFSRILVPAKQKTIYVFFPQHMHFPTRRWFWDCDLTMWFSLSCPYCVERTCGGLTYALTHFTHFTHSYIYTYTYTLTHTLSLISHTARPSSFTKSNPRNSPHIYIYTLPFFHLEYEYKHEHTFYTPHYIPILCCTIPR